ncbi:MAG: DUF2851 family protein [Bacteroidetes bacterium]|nr:DUF2851 family protein [Bacteroidota bacterium]
MHAVNEITIKQQLNRLLTERLEQKALNVENRLILNNQDWEETCYQLIARNFARILMLIHLKVWQEVYLIKLF